MDGKKKDLLYIEVVNNQIAEMKKKIQLLESQRRAQYEMWHTEKKTNAERIKYVKLNIQRMHLQLSTPKIKKELGIGNGALQIRRISEKPIEVLILKVIEARKKLDSLQYEDKQKEYKVAELSEAKLSKRVYRSGKKRIFCPINSVKVLENQIHLVEMNIMEAEHLQKKYHLIKDQLMNESVGFESTMEKLEAKICNQENKIADLQKTFEEFIHLRTITNRRLQEEEGKLTEAHHVLENQMDELRYKFENYKSDLEQLECCIHVIKSDEPEVQSESGSDENGNIQRRSDYLEKIFTHLKDATGVTENEDVLKRFLSQRDTKEILDTMKTMSENEKRLLIQKNEEMKAKIKSYYFSEMNDFEGNEEKFESLQGEIQKEIEDREHNLEIYETLQREMRLIMNRTHCFCLHLKNLDVVNVPQKCPSEEQYKWLFLLFRDKIGSAIRHDKTNAEVHNKSKNTDLWSVLPFSTECKVSDVEDEDEIPTRNSLKSEAQLICEVRSRRRAFRSALGKEL